MGRLNPLKTNIAKQGENMKTQKQSTLREYISSNVGSTIVGIDNEWFCPFCMETYSANVPFALRGGELMCHKCVKRLSTFNEPELPEADTNDVVHLSHYTECGIQPIDYMRANMNQDEFVAYCIGNVIKYVSRYKRKNGLEDLKKAYLDWTIERMQ